WAWTWVSKQFTCGMRTNGRIESENRLNRVFGNYKTTLVRIVEESNDRTKEQYEKDIMSIRAASRKQHQPQLEQLFHLVIQQLHDYSTIDAIQREYQELENSMFYTANSPGSALSSFPVQSNNVTPPPEAGYGMFDSFEDDEQRLGYAHLVECLQEQDMEVERVFEVRHQATGAVHYLIKTGDGTFICDCMQGQNLGLPCRHYWTTFQI
ncbi:hypothetical protein BT69DRAFT_1192840, partial [Atractiella rhizophila]